MQLHITMALFLVSFLLLNNAKCDIDLQVNSITELDTAGIPVVSFEEFSVNDWINTSLFRSNLSISKNAVAQLTTKVTAQTATESPAQYLLQYEISLQHWPYLQSLNTVDFCVSISILTAHDVKSVGSSHIWMDTSEHRMYICHQFTANVTTQSGHLLYHLDDDAENSIQSVDEDDFELDSDSDSNQIQNTSSSMNVMVAESALVESASNSSDEQNKWLLVVLVAIGLVILVFMALFIYLMKSDFFKEAAPEGFSHRRFSRDATKTATVSTRSTMSGFADRRGSDSNDTQYSSVGQDLEPQPYQINVIYDRELEQSETISHNVTRIIHEEADDTVYEPFDQDYDHVMNISIDLGPLMMHERNRTATPTLVTDIDGEDSMQSFVIQRSHDDMDAIREVIPLCE